MAMNNNKAAGIALFVFLMNKLFITMVQIFARTKEGVLAAPEDVTDSTLGMVAKSEGKKTDFAQDGGVEFVTRLSRIQNNNTEGFVYVLGCILVWYMGVIEKGELAKKNNGEMALLFAAAAFRWFHTFFYLLGLQPFRTLSFAISFTLLNVLAIIGITKF